jgi:hypothetical protein
MKTTPTAAMEVILRLSPLRVMLEEEALVGMYRLMCTKQWRPKPTNLVTPKNLRMWSKNQSYRWGLRGYFQDMYTTGHSWSGSLTSATDRIGST